jgi:hypothetical protein
VGALGSASLHGDKRWRGGCSVISYSQGRERESAKGESGLV